LDRVLGLVVWDNLENEVGSSLPAEFDEEYFFELLVIAEVVVVRGVWEYDILISRTG
jgi:hypothetical protein